jgi:hypothetical protein
MLSRIYVSEVTDVNINVTGPPNSTIYVGLDVDKEDSLLLMFPDKKIVSELIKALQAAYLKADINVNDIEIQEGEEPKEYPDDNPEEDK